MPIYEYQCEDCGHKFEVMQRMSDDRLTTCPSCGNDSLKKLISAVGFQLKGTGWYETDFKNKGKAPDKKDGGDSGDSKPKSESKSGDSGSSEKPAGSSAKSDSATKSD